MRSACLSLALAAVLVFPAVASAQGTLADYRRAADLRERLDGRTENIASNPE